MKCDITVVVWPYRCDSDDGWNVIPLLLLWQWWWKKCDITIAVVVWFYRCDSNDEWMNHHQETFLVLYLGENQILFCCCCFCLNGTIVWCNVKGKSDIQWHSPPPPPPPNHTHTSVSNTEHTIRRTESHTQKTQNHTHTQRKCRACSQLRYTLHTAKKVHRIRHTHIKHTVPESMRYIKNHTHIQNRTRRITDSSTYIKHRRQSMRYVHRTTHTHKTWDTQ